MRRIIVSALLVAVALVVQLTTINGLRLPGGGVPDLVLVVVAALGLAGGPTAGAITGFAAGLCLDLAPPASGVIGEYALAFCLVGWACGRLHGTLSRSATLPIVITAVAAAVGEVMVAALGMALQPAQVGWASVRLVLPASAFYDIAISPFLLYLVLLATARLDDDPAASAAASADRARLRRVGRDAATPLPGAAGLAGRPGLAGAAGGAVLLGLGGWLSGPPQSRRDRKAAARRGPRLGSTRPGDGWIGGSVASRSAAARRITSGAGHGPAAPGGQAFTGSHGSSVARLRSGVAGSAAGGQAPRTLAARPVHLRLAAGRKRDGVVGNLLGGRPVLLGGPVAVRVTSPRSFNSLGRRRSRRGGGFRPSVMPGGSALASLRPGGGLAAPAAPRAGWLRPARRGAGRGRDGVVGGGALTAVGWSGRRAAAPRFRIRSSSPAGSAVTGMGAGGSGSLPALRRPAPRRLRMHGRRGDGALGGSLVGGRGAFTARPATPRFRSGSLASTRPMNGKRPRFGSRRWSVLSLLGRSGPTQLWRVGRRTGGSR